MRGKTGKFFVVVDFFVFVLGFFCGFLFCWCVFGFGFFF